MMVLTALLRRCRSEQGTALVVAMGAMSIILLLSAWAAGSSTQLSDSSERDRRSKRALPATEAGIRQALYNRNNLVASGQQCATGEAVTANGLYCYKQEALEGGVTYDYWTTVASPATCAGFPVDAADTKIEERCVTVKATVGDQVRRAQARLVRAAPSLFPFKGVFGDELVSIGSTSTINEDASQVGGSLGSNTRVYLNNDGNCVEGGVLLGTPSAIGPGSSKLVGQAPCDNRVIPRTAAEGPFVLTPVDFAQSVSSNQNANLGSGYNPANREFSRNSGFTLNGGTYNLCYFYVKEGTVRINGEVTIFIDSSTRPGNGGCAARTDKVVTENEVVFQTAGAAENFKIFVHGGGRVYFNNKVTFNGYIHAPDAEVNFNNDSTLTGAVASKRVIANGRLTFNASNNALPQGQTQGRFSRTAWRECTPQPTVANDPASGC